MSKNEKFFTFNVVNTVWIFILVGLLIFAVNGYVFRGLFVLDKELTYKSVLSMLCIPTYIYFVFYGIKKIKRNKDDYVKINGGEVIYKNSEGIITVSAQEVMESYLIHNLMNKEIVIRTNGTSFKIDAYGFPREVLQLPKMIEKEKNSEG